MPQVPDPHRVERSHPTTDPAGGVEPAEPTSNTVLETLESKPSDPAEQSRNVDPDGALSTGLPADSSEPTSTFGILKPWMFRLLALMVAAAPLTALAVASQLTPDTRGLGTHQQLGLPPCSMRLLWGIRCPGCGMTTSWAYFTQGAWRASAATNIAGFLLAWYSIAVAAIALKSVFTACLPSLRTQQLATLAGFAIGLIALANWAIRLAGW